MMDRQAAGPFNAAKSKYPYPEWDDALQIITYKNSSILVNSVQYCVPHTITGLNIFQKGQISAHDEEWARAVSRMMLFPCFIFLYSGR